MLPQKSTMKHLITKIFLSFLISKFFTMLYSQECKVISQYIKYEIVYNSHDMAMCEMYIECP